MHAVVTGGAGFIGSTLVCTLLGDGYEVTVVDDLRRGRRENLDAVADRIELCTMDINDSALSEVFAAVAPEVVFHLAAQIDVRRSVEDPIDDATQNVLGTINVAQAAHATGVSKIVFASSGGSIYGSPTTLPTPETAPMHPVSPYAASKVAGETYLNMFRELYGIDCVHLALSNVYGPRQDPDGEAGVIAIFSQALLRGAATTVFGSGSNTRDYVYVDDVAAAFLSAATGTGDGRRYNIGTGRQTSDRELHTLVADAAGAPDAPSSAPSRAGDLATSALDPRRAQDELGWVPTIDIAEGISRTVSYFRTTMAANQ